MNAPSSEAHRHTLARPPSPRRAPDSATAAVDAAGPAVPFAALATLLGLTVGAGPCASYSFTLDGTEGLAIGAAGSGAYRTVPDLAMRMVFDQCCFAGVALPGGMEERVVGGAAYVRAGLPGPGGGWARVPLVGTATGLDALDRLLARAREADAPLRMLLDAGHLAPVGAEAVEGVPTTHYSGELQLCPEAAGSLTQDQLGIARVGMEVWVDATGRPRRFVALAPTPAGQIRMALTFTGAVPAEISAPALT